MDALSRQRVLVRKRSGEKVMKTLFFFAADAGNVGQEDPTVWIGYMCMIAISFSQQLFCGNFSGISFCGKVLVANHLSPRK